MIQIGPYTLHGRAVLAPMAGVSDFPFRKICRRMGAAMVTAEMSASDPALRHTHKSLTRLTHPDDDEPRAIQIVGTDPHQMAMAAQYQVEHGAQIVDINMGCPAKKVCKKLAGSALMKDEVKVRQILEAVVASVDVPVTLKIRTGWDPQSRNAVNIAKMAEDIGIQSLAVHGRTRACRYHGNAEYDTIAAVVQAVNIPVFANGDITSAIKAKRVLDYTDASGVMIGRGAQGRPWIFQEINHLLGHSKASSELFTGKSLSFCDTNNKERLIIEHLTQIHHYYDTGLGLNPDGSKCKSDADTGGFGNSQSNNSSEAIENQEKVVKQPNLAVKMARKHVCWYFEQMASSIVEQYQDKDEHDLNKTQPLPVVVAANKNRTTTLKATETTTDRLEREKLEQAAQALKESCTIPQEVQQLTDKIVIARKQFNQLGSCSAQLEHIKHFFGELQTTGDIAA